MEAQVSSVGAGHQPLPTLPRQSRSRSNTATSVGPVSKSRASTASVQSAGQRFALASQSQENAFQNQMQAATQNMMIQQQQPVGGMPVVTQGFSIDPALQPVAPNQANRSMAYQPVPPGFEHQVMPSPQYGQFQGYAGPDMRIVERFSEDMPIVEKVKKGSASSIANDNELRRLHRENKGRNLKDVAAQVLASERGPKSEKTRQIFAMLWLEATCRRSNGSVPRNRVYSHYATRCGTERVPPLNPASFGKLVRIIFPGIQTRRLGVRGESKYHYVDLTLEEDQQALIDQQQRARAASYHHCQQSISNRSTSSDGSQLPNDLSLFPSPTDAMAKAKGPKRTSEFSRKSIAYGVFSSIEVSNPAFPVSPTSAMERPLHFSMTPDSPFLSNEPIELPNIHDYAPPGTDKDTADALSALYRSHVVSVIDCLRFCKEKQLFHHYASFHGNLTVPVQKLLSEPTMAPWIRACDWLMYQNMVRCVGHLTLQVLPMPVLSILKAISQKITTHICSCFGNLPLHVIEAKLEPAAIFAKLISRLIRVNEFSHNAANQLCNDANRNQMWREWAMHVKPTTILETAIPICGYQKAWDILTQDIRSLLLPLEDMTPMSNLGPYDISHNDEPAFDLSENQSHLDRWSAFLRSLPSRFQAAAELDPKLIIDVVTAVGCAVIRDITLGQGQSFGSWWVVKAWVDEMMLWLAEKGGFMAHEPDPPVTNSTTDAQLSMVVLKNDQPDLRPRTAASQQTDDEMKIDFSLSTSSNGEIIQPPELGQPGNNDDSAISMGDEFNPEKWTAVLPPGPTTENVV